MKTDFELKRDVQAELAWDPQIKSTAVGVAVKDGVVTVTGHLDTFAEKHAVTKALRRVSGVLAIALEVDVRLSPDHVRSDTDIAQSCEMALRWNTTTPRDRIQVTVERGHVALRGELEWEYQRRSVEKAIRPLMGVVSISNEITLRVQPKPADLERRIHDALARQAEREAKRLKVNVDGHTVTLSGQVHSWHERDAAQGVAWSAPGVRTVINEITVE